MNNVFRKYVVPLLVLILGGFIIRLQYDLLAASIANPLVIITQALIMFGFGISISTSKRRRNESWLKKIIISFFLMFFIFWDLGYIVLPQLKAFFNFLGFSGFVVHCFYVYLGASFFD